MCLRLFCQIEAYNYLVDILQVIPTAMLRRLVIPCAIRACVLAYKYNEEAADASEAQTADLGKSFDAQKEETSAKAFERQKQVLDDDMKEAQLR